MHETEFSDQRKVEHDRAILEVTKVLRVHTHASAVRQDSETVKSSYEKRPFDSGWRIPIDFSDGMRRNIDILVSPSFPRTPPRAALVDRPKYLTWPHIERDGVLCLLRNSSEIDPEAPGDVALNILNRSVTLVEELIDGQIIARDFKDEFLTYWFYDCNDVAKNIIVLFDPTGPSRLLTRFTFGGLVYVAENVDALSRWIGHRFGSKAANKVAKDAMQTVLIWLKEPPLPSEYPKIGSDLLKFDDKIDSETFDLLRKVTQSSHKEVLVLLGAEGRGGPGVVAVRIDPNRSHGAGKSRDRKHKGFRVGHLPADIGIDRTFGSDIQVNRTQVERADSAWIHGRGQDARSRILLKKSVTVFGCGSVGSFIAEHLARAGVGFLNLVDFDALCWANVGRHVLGASASGQKKALTLADALQCNYPHLAICGYDSNIESTLCKDTAGLLRSDLIIGTMGNWAAESLLNKWHLESGSDKPVLYGWTEDYAVSGSAVVIAPGESCLACGIGRTGQPHITATAWPEKTEVNTEPSCADHYQPYGAIELAFITAMIASTAVDEILSPSTKSYRNIWFSSKIVDYGGTFSDEFTKVIEGNTTDSGIVTLDWSSERCSLCSVKRKSCP